MASTVGAPKESISELVKQLLTLDETERRTQLASLSEYTKTRAEGQRIEERSTQEAIKATSLASTGSTGTGKHSSGSGSGSGAGSGDEETSAENSGDDSSGKDAGWPILPPGLPQPGARKVPLPAVFSHDPTWNTEMGSEAAKPSQEDSWALPSEFAELPCMETGLQNSLLKVLKELSQSMPPQQAAVAQQLMALTSEESGRQRMQTLQNFRTHLEWQQEESIQKINRILQSQEEEQPMITSMPYGQANAIAQPPYGTHMYVGPQSLADYSSEAWQYGPASVVPGMGFSLPDREQCGNYGQLGFGGLPPRGPRTLPPRFLSRPAKTQTPPGLIGRGIRPAAGARQNGSAAQGSVKETGSEYTLRSHLRELQKVELARIVLIRKISKLGFDSAPILEAHYSHFGKVEKVLVAHSHVKPQHCGQGMRLRPSGLGFVVMSQASEVEAILAAGESQTVHGVRIQVRHFERRSANDLDEEADGQDS